MSTARSPRVALLWHLHQPDYRHPETGVPMMPWVRMHCVRGYRDVVLETLEGAVPVTINVVPSLLDQIEAYAAGGVDRHLQLSRVPAESLSPAQQAEIRATFVGGHEAMAQDMASWRRLRARLLGGDILQPFEWRDVQVGSNLQWFGATALRDFPELAELRAKGHHYTPEDLAQVLARFDQVLSEMPVLLRRLAQARGPAMSVSPYFHPILPLLVDTASAQRALPGLPNDGAFAWPEDARWQLQAARDRVERWGRKPVGLWPSEGAVSPEVAEIASEVGFRWLATDEGVLAGSDRSAGVGDGPWRLTGSLKAFFRDRELSDWIGFHAVQADPRRGIAELMARIAARRTDNGLVVLALDGENPWEAFPDAGGAFRAALHRALAEGPVRGVTLDDAAEEPAVGAIRRLHTGSWIRANLAIWYGHPDDRAAWREIARLRAAIAGERDPVRAARALDALRPAEGSDWMWWYGDDFETPFAQAFDDLFRAHLLAGWRALEQRPPDALMRSLRSGPPPFQRPAGWVQPTAERPPCWLDWRQAGHLRFPEGAMADGQVAPPRVAFGWTKAGELWLRGEEPLGPWRLMVNGAELTSGPKPPGRDALVLLDFGALGWVARVEAGRAALSWVHQARTLGPLTLEPPPDAGWWEV